MSFLGLPVRSLSYEPNATPQDKLIAELSAAAQDPSSAAHALRAIHTQEALPFLATLLDSETADWRYDAVAGIASFANGLPIQTKANYANMTFLKPSPSARRFS